MYDAERGLFDLRQGRPLYVSGSSDARSGPGVLLATVDTLGQRTLETLGGLGTAPRLVVTHHRARAMGLGNGGPSRDVSLGLNGATQPEQILSLCIAAGRFQAPDLDPRPATTPESSGLTLARLAGLLPAIIGVSLNGRGADGLGPGLASGEILSVTAAQVEAFAADERVEVTHVSDGPVPLEHAEDARFMVFREGNSFREHVAVMIGDPATWPDPVPVRLHSACLTGDLFGSLRCDCGEQLRGSLRVFTASGGGVLLYLAQEGRGIGLGNKMRAYSLQHTGLDTVDADEVLGFGDDERGYHAAVGMLRHIGVERVILLTNNPHKVAALRDEGIDVVERRPLFGTLNRHNLPYVKAKVDRAGHWLTDMLAGAPSHE
jgi:GTP cyclohydrolase II